MELKHHGILGQKWGRRRYQNEDGSYTEEGLARLRAKDTKYVKKNYDKIYKKAYSKSRQELDSYVRNDLNRRTDLSKYNADGKLSASYLNEFNRTMAEIMTTNAADIKTPNLGLAIKFIAKRGEAGVHMIMSDQAFNVETLKNGVYASGRIAYKQKQVNMA